MKNYMKKIIIGVLGFAMIFSAQSAFAHVFWTGETNDFVPGYNNNSNCTISDFHASNNNISNGDHVTLEWNTTGCTHVSISNIGNVSNNGSQNVYPSYDTTYTLTAYSQNGPQRTSSIKIYVEEENNHYSDCYINNFSSDKTYINSGDSITLRWNTTDCDSVNITSLGSVSVDGSRVVYPSGTMTYVLNAYGDNSQSRSVTVNMRSIPVVPVYNTNVVTTVATNITETTAQLNGLVTSSNYNNTNVHFEYGTTVSLGNKTVQRTTNGNANFSEIITGLTANTIYFFQAVSEGSNGISRGAIEGFVTEGSNISTNPANYTKPKITQGSTVSSSMSPIMLRIENKYKTIGVGDMVDYVVTYKNIGKTKLTNPMIQVVLPKGITFVNTSAGEYSESDRTMSAPLEDLNPEKEGVIYLQGKVENIDPNLAQIVTTTLLIYTNENGAQENAIAYVLNSPKEQNLLGASAFTGKMFGFNLIDWLLLIIVIMILALISRSIFKRNSTAQASHSH